MHPTEKPTPFSRLVGELGLIDVWRIRHPNVKNFSCHSASYDGLSRIDLGLDNGSILSLIAEFHYEQRHISDHSPFWVELVFPEAPRHVSWKLNPFWLTVFPDQDPIPKLLKAFFRTNLNSADIGVIRGQFIYLINNIKTSTRAWETFILTEAGRAEEAYVNNLTDDTKRPWLVAQSMSRQVELQLAENKRFFLQQKHYEVEETTRHMLAMLICNRQSSAHVDQLYNSHGCISTSTKDILEAFHSFYKDLYTSKVHPTGGEIASFLDECFLPCLSSQDKKLLNEPITEEELLLALKQAPNGKSPGTDGLRLRYMGDI